MSAGDNTRDDRWRPGFASSERRVREELADAATEPERRVFSRELSFVPSQADAEVRGSRCTDACADRRVQAAGAVPARRFGADALGGLGS